jgi:hypothetical protein
MRVTGLLLLLLLLCTHAHGDHVYLKNGNILSGEVTEHDTYIMLKTRHGTTRIERSQIQKIVGSGRGLSEEAEQAFLKSIELDNDHAEARKALGHSRIGGEWVDGEWHTLTDGNIVYRYTVGRTLLNRYQSRVRAFRKAFVEYYKDDFTIQPFDDVVILQLFNNREDYEAFLQNGVEQNKLNGQFAKVRGYTDHGNNKVITYIEPGKIETLVGTYVMFHELGHLLTYRYITRPQFGLAWFQEGWADFLAGSQYTGASVRMAEIDKANGVVRGRAKTIRDARASGAFIPFTEMIRDKEVDFSVKDPNILYAESWAIVYYLHHADGGKHRSRFIRYVNKVIESGAFKEEDFRLTFGDPEELEKNVLAWLDTEFPN